jgi:hypothetical protein
MSLRYINDDGPAPSRALCHFNSSSEVIRLAVQMVTSSERLLFSKRFVMSGLERWPADEVAFQSGMVVDGGVDRGESL